MRYPASRALDEFYATLRKRRCRALAEGQLVGYRCVRGGNERRIIDRQFWLFRTRGRLARVDARGSIGPFEEIVVCLHFLLQTRRLSDRLGVHSRRYFDRYVLRDPEVAAWGRKAIRAGERVRAGIHSWTLPTLHGVHEWPVAFERGRSGGRASGHLKNGDPWSGTKAGSYRSCHCSGGADESFRCPDHHASVR